MTQPVVLTKRLDPWGLFLAGVGCLPVSTILLLPLWVFSLGAQWREERPQLSHGGMRWLGVVSLGLVGGTLLSYRPLESLGGLFNYLPFFLFFWLITRLVQTRERMRQVLTVSLVAAGVTGLAGVVEWISGWNWQWKILGVLEVTIGSQAEPGILDRVTSFFFWPTSTAAYFLLVIPLALVFWVGQPQNPLGYGFLGGGFAALIALVGTASRNAWGAIIFVLGLLLVYTRRWLILVLIALGVGVVFTAALGPPPMATPLRHVVPTFIWQKVLDTIDPKVKAYESTALRLEAWQIATQMTQSRPWTGWGLQTFPFVSVEVYGKKGLTVHAHNFYLTYMAEMGIPLALVLLGFYGSVLLRAGTALPRLPVEVRWWCLGLILGLVGYFCFGLFDVAFYESRVNAQFWLWLGLLWQMPSLEEEHAQGLSG